MSGGCQLLRIERAAAAERRGTIVALHADAADARQLLELCERAGAGFDVVAPQAPRARNPFYSSASPDDPRWRDYAGFSWFRRGADGRLEPASFGDSLAQLEKLALERLETGGAPLVWLGRGDGATLAFALALARPDLVHAIAADGGAPPDLPGWSDGRTLAPLLPVLELRGPDTAALQRFLERISGGHDDGRG